MRQPLQILVDAIPDAALRPLLLELLQNGATSAQVPTPNGGTWHAGSVIRVQRRL
jgi:hypothetical protein